MFEKPQVGICVDASTRGNPGISEFRAYDLSEKRIVFTSKKFWATNNIAEFLALVNAVHYCFKNEIDNLFTDSMTAIAWVKSKRVNSSLAKTSKTEETIQRVNKAIEYLKTLRYDSYNDSLIDSDGKAVFINKWLTSEWGEIPADYGLK